jgi:hypothetical protein
MFGWVPGLEVISSYRRRWLLKDVIAGVVLTTLLVPQARQPPIATRRPLDFAAIGPVLRAGEGMRRVRR